VSTRARVGIFALLALIGAFAAYYFITNLGLRSSGYQIGIRFRDVGGLQEGSTVLLSGVEVGEVTSVALLPDESVEVICTIRRGNHLYRHSGYSVATTLTGSTTLAVTLPRHRDADDVLPERVLPEDEQPWGTLPPTIADLVSAGQEQLRNFSKTMKVVNAELPGIARRFSLVAMHTDELVVHTDETLVVLSGQLRDTVALLDTTIATSGRNVNQLTGNVNGLLADNRQKIGELIAHLADTTKQLDRTLSGVASIAQDPLLHASLVGTVANMQAATAKLKAIATEVEGITGDPKTQDQLRGAIQNLDAASAKVNAILGGGEGQTASQTQSSPAPAPSGAPLRGGLFGQPLVQAHVRETWGNRGGGPASDLNVDLLPGARTHLTFGANDLGYSTTYNFLLDRSTDPSLQVGAGVLYSKLGIAALFRPFGNPVGIDARLYDPKHPTLDLYGDLRLTQRLQLFYGERSLFGPAAKTPSFGFQINY
jgi:phospholipid/cholesterol/gamma-HCH transport system substrate-binding protein